jgi:hypothetical protein
MTNKTGWADPIDDDFQGFAPERNPDKLTGLQATDGEFVGIRRDRQVR